ncbi:MAG: 50S ribosomal protein L19 [Phycisphaerales bacterium]
MNTGAIVEAVVADQLKGSDDFPPFSVGDTLNVHVRIIEGEKERIQIFQGVLIAEKGRGINRMLTVRRIVANEGVERIFPLHSPRVAQIDVVRRGDARRAKLYYLRDRVGKSRRLRDQRRGIKHVESYDQMIAARAKAGNKKAAPAADAAE